MIKYRKIAVDLLVNIISYGLPIVLLQFLLLPILARDMSEDNYGLLLSLTSVVSIFAEMTCGNLANVRILLNDEYLRKDAIGNFKSLLYIMVFLSSFVVGLVSILLYSVSIQETILLLIYYILLSFRSYYIAGFRIENNYNKLMINNMIMCVGYLIGIALFQVWAVWQIAYIIPAGLACLHACKKTSLLKEQKKVTAEFMPLTNKTGSFMISYVLGSGMTYFDRIYLYPILGGAAVSTYHVSTLMGKFLSMLIAPMNMVILSYAAKIKVFTQKMKLGIIIADLIFCGGFAFVAIFLSPIVIQVLYPQYFSLAKEFIPIVTIATCIFSAATVLRVISMRLVSHNMIFAIESVYAILYVSMSVFFLNLNGLMGFCYATLVAAIVRFSLFGGSLLLYGKGN